MKEMIDSVGMNCYNRDTISLHRLTEIGYMNEVVVRKGNKYGVPTPYCAFLTSLIHCKEQILKAH